MIRKQFSLLIAAILLIGCFIPVLATARASLTIADMVIIAKCMNGQMELTAEQLEIYDTNGDGRVNVVDLVAVAKIITGGSAPVPATRPDYAQLVYSQGAVNVTVGDLTQIGILIGGMLNGADELDFNQSGIPIQPLLAGITELQVLRSNPGAYAVLGPLGSSLSTQICAVLDQMQISAEGILQIPQQPVRSFAKMLFGTSALTGDLNTSGDAWETSVADPVYASEVELVQFARYRHTTLALAVYDVTVQENAFGIAPGKIRIGMQFEISSNALRIRPMKLMRLAPGQLEEANDFTAVFFPAKVPV